MTMSSLCLKQPDNSLPMFCPISPLSKHKEPGNMVGFLFINIMIPLCIWITIKLKISLGHKISENECTKFSFSISVTERLLIVILIILQKKPSYFLNWHILI